MTDLIFTGLSFVVIACAAVFSFLAYRVMQRAANPRARILSLKLAGIITVWLIITATLAGSGFLAQWRSRPPHFPIVPICALIGVLLLHLARPTRATIPATPRQWPVAFQIFRIGVELSFFALVRAGYAPVQVSFEGRNFDVLVGLTAPIVAFAIVRFRLGPRLVILWNLLGLLILGNTIVTTMSSLPGPLHLNWPGQPFTAFGHLPFVWIPAFLAPMAIFLHIFSIRQNLALLFSKARIASVTWTDPLKWP